jgi:hypothetical protein
MGSLHDGHVTGLGDELHTSLYTKSSTRRLFVNCRPWQIESFYQTALRLFFRWRVLFHEPIPTLLLGYSSGPRYNIRSENSVHHGLHRLLVQTAGLCCCCRQLRIYRGSISINSRNLILESVKLFL